MSATELNHDGPAEEVALPAAAATVRPPTPMAVRTGLGLALIACLGLLLAIGSNWPQGFVYAGLGMAAVALASREFARMAERIGVEVSSRFLVFGGVALFLLHWAGLVSPAIPRLTAPAFFFLMMFTLVTERILRARIDGALEGLALAALGLLYIPVLLGFMTAIRVRWGVLGLVTTLAVCKGSAMGAYFVGKTLGRTKLAPLVSPRKTVAGAVGAMAAGIGIAYALSRSPWAMMSPAAALAYGAIIACVAMIGDLVASLLKRQAGLKDSGHLLPGFGGAIDILDDVLFAAPVSFAAFVLCEHFALGG